jgi:sec-independent protein translocase protein TatB
LSSGVGFNELIVLFIIGLLILGPEKLPRVATQIGRWVGKARRTANQLRYQLEREIALADIDKKSNRRNDSKQEDSKNSSPSGTTDTSGNNSADKGGDQDQDSPPVPPEPEDSIAGSERPASKSDSGASGKTD